MKGSLKSIFFTIFFILPLTFGVLFAHAHHHEHHEVLSFHEHDSCVSCELIDILRSGTAIGITCPVLADAEIETAGDQYQFNLQFLLAESRSIRAPPALIFA